MDVAEHVKCFLHLPMVGDRDLALLEPNPRSLYVKRRFDIPLIETSLIVGIANDCPSQESDLCAPAHKGTSYPQTFPFFVHKEELLKMLRSLSAAVAPVRR